MGLGLTVCSEVLLILVIEQLPHVSDERLRAIPVNGQSSHALNKLLMGQFFAHDLTLRTSRNRPSK
ncbi:hypothetical protein PSYJA_01219 [Pseudomonas syringae pv. japonica str. M301072]|uniref:Uncharacterized protein n=1 Tax=Pseudomonas syringae pv. japonica str. M301072 TaxID=629262 RepID=F3FBX5_PSESX|nr:hypothetical protein PSYJA_01219 [Pseudomonas syringae pv. japonica str. M301072]